ncbi:MAG: cysteine desulfurase [Vampirovibrionales bacterium]|nr:cysteine desulfurase [Vampirovibrionales bacterium]
MTLLNPLHNIKSHFPVLNNTVNGYPLVYLDTAATAQKPQCVIDALTQFLTHDYGTVRRGLYHLSVGATAKFDETREAVARFINAPSSDQIIFTRGATEAINIVAHGFAEAILKPGDAVVISAMEHHANLVPWQQACLKTGAELRIIPVLDDGTLDLSQLDALLSGSVKLLAVTHVSNVLGTINPIEQLARAAKAKRVPLLLDGCQAAPHLKLDMQALDCDFYAFSAHKLYGPTGVGVLYAKPEWLEQLPPYQFGGDMIDSVNFERSTFAHVPHKFEAGTPAIAEVIALKAALDFIETIGHDAIAAHEHALLTQAMQGLAQIEGLRFIGTAPDKAAVIAFAIEGANGLQPVHPLDLATLLDQYGIAIRTGHHCAQPLMQRFGVTACARASFGVYNTPDDVDAFITAMHKALKLLR